MNSLIYILFILLSVTGSTFCFDGSIAFDIATTLGSDDFEGRRPGFRGGTKTEEFLAGKLAEFGIAASGRDGYFQSVPLLVTEQQSAQLTLMNHELGKIQFHQGTDFTVVTHSGSASLVANVVVVGYGISRPDKDRDDYSGIDVKGKVVLIIRGTPESSWDFSEDFPRAKSLQWAKEHEAAGVLWYAGSSLVNGAAIPAESYDPQFPLFYVGDRVVNTLFDGSGYTIDTYKEKIKTSPFPLDIKKEMWLNVKVRKLTNPVCRNVIGIVYGTDPVLKNELIVVGAHMDHIGKNSDGAIYNGADDNGSGSGLICELGRQVALAPLKRSVLICLFTGEEDGLLGSAHFCEQPTIPFGNIATMLNFDMEGQGNGKVGIQGGELLGPLWNDYAATLDSAAKANTEMSRSSGGGASDHESFMKAGIPAISFWSSGSHPFWHKYTDESPWISQSVLQAVGDRAEQLVRFLGSVPQPLAFRADTLTLLARFSESINFDGIPLDNKMVVPEFRVPTAAWLPADSKTLTTELIRRSYEFTYVCDQRNATSTGLSAAVTARDKHKLGAFIGINESAMSSRKNYEVSSLVKQGLSVIRLAPADTKKGAATSSDALTAAKTSGAFALMPLDFTTPAQIEIWGGHSIVRTTLSELAAMPDEARTGLLTSTALVFCDQKTAPSAEQIALIRPYSARLIHININENGNLNRESVARDVVAELVGAGCTRDEVLRLTTGNLRRFLAAGTSHSGAAHD